LGVVSRAARDAQRQHLSPPSLHGNSFAKNGHR
jgi:hypothetical protein